MDAQGQEPVLTFLWPVYLGAQPAAKFVIDVHLGTSLCKGKLSIAAQTQTSVGSTVASTGYGC